MGTTLHIVSSPRGARSLSRLVAEALVAELHALRPDERVDTLDLWLDRVTTFDGTVVAAKMAVIEGHELDGRQRATWEAIRRECARFASADTYVLGVPMWNGGIPWILKRYIDTITQPGLLFSYDPVTGYEGLLRGKRAVVAYTSANYHPGVPPAFGTDHHSSYVEDWLRQVGVAQIHTLRLQPTSHRSPDLTARTADALAEACALAGALAATPRQHAVLPDGGAHDPSAPPAA